MKRLITTIALALLLVPATFAGYVPGCVPK